MFKILVEKKYDAIIKNDAKPEIIKDRLSYQEIVDFIIKYVNTHKLLISNINLLLGKQEYWDSVDIFTLDIDNISKELVKELCSKFDKLFLLKIVKENTEYFIEYNLIKICNINTINPYKSFTLYDFISPIKYEVSNTTIFLFPYLIEIIYLYNKLYSPAFASDWEEVYEDIKKIEVFVDKDIDKILLMPKTSMQEYISTSGGECTKNKCKDTQDAKIAEIKKLLLDFIKNEHYILCNEFYDFENPSGIIELISANIDADFKLIVNSLSKYIEYGITYKKKSIYLPKENQMEKYNFYIEIPFVKNIKKKHFLTIYNNTSYELVNYYEKDGYKFADPITQLKFVYLSIWSSIVMQKTHGLHYEEFIAQLNLKKEELSKLRNKIDIYGTKKNYTGSYLSESMSKKLTADYTNIKSNYYCHDF